MTKEEHPVTPTFSRRLLVLTSVLGMVVASLGLASAADASSSHTSGSTVESPPSGSISLTETGSTLLYPLWNLWVPAYTSKYPNVAVTTAGTGSGTGITDASNGTVDIGSSDAYLSPSEVSASPHLENIPLAISAQFIGYNVPGVSVHLKLDGNVLAEIYQGKVTNWNSSAIADLNKGVSLPNLPIVPLHRTDGSGDTFLFTTYLSKTEFCLGFQRGLQHQR